jgi:uncharacterized protein (DUF697 family)
MFERVKHWWAREREQTDADFQKRLDELRRREPVPVFWLFGKTQSGKTTVVRYLTGATDAEIGSGFQPCTRFSRKYDFPNSEAQLLEFLDTRGVDEPGYDPSDDLAQFNHSAHVVIITVKAMDHAQENVINHLRVIREARPERPVLLLLTCLHEAYPQQQHTRYPFRAYRGDEPIIVPDTTGMLNDLLRSLEQQRRRFAGLVDWVLPIDITRPEEGYDEPEYGGPALRTTLMDLLPQAQRHTLEMVEKHLADLKELHARKVLPTIYGYSLLAGTAGAIPVPFLALLLLPRIQRKMIENLATQFGRPLSAEQFVPLAEKLGIGSLRRTAVGELLKFVPYVGVVAGATAHAASTYALGKAFSHYDALTVDGMDVDVEQLRDYYQTQLKEAAHIWKTKNEQPSEPVATGAGGSR